MMVNDCRSIFIRSEDRLADEHAQYPTRRRKMNRNHVHDGEINATDCVEITNSLWREMLMANGEPDN